MALNTQTNNPSAQATQGATQQKQYTNTNVSFGLSSRISLAAEGEYYNKLFNKLSEKIKPINESNAVSKISMVRMLKQDAGLNYSCIVLAETANDLTVAHALIIERTGEYPSPVYESIGGNRFEFLRVPGDAMDGKLLSQVAKMTASTLGVDPSSVVVVDGTLVPNEFNVDEETDVQRLLSNSVSSLDVEIAVRINNYQGINIEQIVNTNKVGKFSINMAFNSSDIVVLDETNMPIRQDICITLSYKLPNMGSNRSINETQNSVDLCKTYGYVDFDFVASPVPMNSMGYTPQKFTPNFVITKIEAVTNMPTPDITLLGVLSVMAVNEDMNWMQSFKPSPLKKGDVDYTDIGALNIEGNVENAPQGFGKKINTKSKEFTLLDLNALVGDLVRPNIAISIDIPQVSPDTWYTSVFGFASQQTPVGQAAAKRIYNAANNMSNGIFGKLVNGQALSPFTPLTNKIHGGKFITKDGARDIRTLGSYLAVANYVAETNQQPTLLIQYTNTLYNMGVPSEIRAAERKKFLDNMSNGTAVYKQFYTRYTFSSGFLNALLNSVRQCGFVPVLDNAFSGSDMFQRRATLDMSQSMLSNDARLTGMNNVYGNYMYTPGYTRNF